MEVGGYIGVDGVFGMDGMPCLEAARKNSCSISSRCLPCSEVVVKGECTGRGGGCGVWYYGWISSCPKAAWNVGGYIGVASGMEACLVLKRRGGRRGA